MTHLEILQKAIEKAVKNGMNRGDFNTPGSIFSHDFAKAFWPTHIYGWIVTDGKEGLDALASEKTIEAWQYHLQQMVISEDPILYLERFI